MEALQEAYRQISDAPGVTEDRVDARRSRPSPSALELSQETDTSRLPDAGPQVSDDLVASVQSFQPPSSNSRSPPLVRRSPRRPGMSTLTQTGLQESRGFQRALEPSVWVSP
ncbi:unnamed protein product [Gadus morhua 'NCC']